MLEDNYGKNRDSLTFDPSGRWWRGPNLNLDLVRGHLDPPEKVKLMDSTLREGEETPGIYLTQAQKISLAHQLEAAGFTELEVGYVGIIAEHLELAHALKKSGLKAKVASHTRAYAREKEWQEEIDRNIDAGCDILTFVGFGSSAMLQTTPWLSEDELPERFAACVEKAKSQGVMATFSLAGSDLLRTPLTKIATYYQAAAEAGADRVYVSDGTGSATPEAVTFFTRFLRDVTGPRPEIGLHLHNTFGLALANALAGVLAGARIVDTSVLGMGDGAGITATEEVILALQVLYDVQTGIDLTQITDLCRTVQNTFGIAVSPNKPWVGENIYRHQIDSHVAAILRRGWQTWEVVRAEALGRERRLEVSIGKLREGRSGAIAAKLEQMGLEVTDLELEKIYAVLRETLKAKRYATEDEIEAIIRQVTTEED